MASHTAPTAAGSGGGEAGAEGAILTRHPAVMRHLRYVCMPGYVSVSVSRCVFGLFFLFVGRRPLPVFVSRQLSTRIELRRWPLQAVIETNYDDLRYGRVFPITYR